MVGDFAVSPKVATAGGGDLHACRMFCAVGSGWRRVGDRMTNRESERQKKRARVWRERCGGDGDDGRGGIANGRTRGVKREWKGEPSDNQGRIAASHCLKCCRREEACGCSSRVQFVWCFGKEKNMHGPLGELWCGWCLVAAAVAAEGRAR